jgi:hypothetical protein
VVASRLPSINWGEAGDAVPEGDLQGEVEANAPLREALAIKRERLRAKRAAKQRSS